MTVFALRRYRPLPGASTSPLSFRQDGSGIRLKLHASALPAAHAARGRDPFRRDRTPAGGRGARRPRRLSCLPDTRDHEGEPLRDRDLRDQLVTLPMTGHETRATSLVWVLARVLAHPDVQARLRDELARTRRIG